MQLLKWRLARAAALSLAASALLVTFARDAAARDTFPAVVKEKLKLECPPTCLPCHTDVPGTRANLREDGLALALLRNMPPGIKNDAQLATVLDKMLATGTTAVLPGDSDGDGTADLAQLAAGLDPYSGDPICSGPKYGCGASSIAPSVPTRFGAFAFALALSAALLRRRRRAD